MAGSNDNFISNSIVSNKQLSQRPVLNILHIQNKNDAIERKNGAI